MNQHGKRLDHSSHIHPAHDLGLPQEVHVYHSLYPLQHSQMAMSEVSSYFGYPTSVYKAVSSADGRTYVLYRIDGR